MNDILRNSIIGLIIAGALMGAGFHFGDKKATEKYLPQLTELKTRIDVADEQARLTVIKQKENEIAISNEINDSITRINDHYARLLSKARNKASTSTSANRTQEVNGQTTELQAAILFEQACALDANQIIEYQRWIDVNQFPISD